MKSIDEILFEVSTPLGFSVRVMKEYWQVITTHKHPVMSGKEDLVRDTIQNPDEIRLSKSDSNVYLFIELCVRKDGSAR